MALTATSSPWAVTGSVNCRPVAARSCEVRRAVRFDRRARSASGFDAKSLRQPPTDFSPAGGSPRKENVVPDGTFPDRRSAWVVRPG